MPSIKLSDQPHFVIDKQYHSKACDQRIQYLVLHYTAEDFKKSLWHLMGDDPDHQVSAHYLVSDKVDEESPSIVYQLVDEKMRAWHAGISTWGFESGLNNGSIGIETVNLDGNRLPYQDIQIQAILQLCQDIIKRHDIKAVNVIGHSDIAPQRKSDPGALFPWEELYKNNIGAWPDASDVQDFMKEAIPDIHSLQVYLRKYGYGIDLTGVNDEQTKNVVIAFQRHFRPKSYCGQIDQETYAILRALLKKYRS